MVSIAYKGVYMGIDEQDALTMEGQADSSQDKSALNEATLDKGDEGSMENLLNHSGPGGGAMRTLRRGDVI